MRELKNKYQTIYLTDTERLLEMIAWARLNDMNRTARGFDASKLDLSGTHVCALIFQHKHRAGEPVDLHYRTQWMCKCVGETEPSVIFIDISVELFERKTFTERHEVGTQIIKGT